VQKVSRLVPKPSVRCGRPDFEKFTFDFTSRDVLWRNEPYVLSLDCFFPVQTHHWVWRQNE